MVTARILRLLLAAVIVGSAATACALAPQEPGAPSLLFVDGWVRGRSKIWDVAFPPASLPPIYTENDTGNILARQSNEETARPLGAVVQFDPAFDPSGEGGLMGIALSPGFASTDWRAFVCYSTTTDNRVARFDVNFAGGPYAALGNWVPIVTGLPHAGIHNGCRVRFQPGTGALFVSTGDAAVASAPQSTTSMGGKVLRIDQDGHAWPGNASGSLWYTRGHRNPQGIAFRPGSNDPYSVEHGPDVDDEVNKLVNGANGGWNPNTGGAYDQRRPMTDPSLDPGATMSPVWTSGGVTVAPSGATFLSGARWKGWDGALVVACLDGSPSVGQRLLVMHLNASGTALTSAPVSVLAISSRLRSAVQGPDGDLYVVTDAANGGGAIWRILPT